MSPRGPYSLSEWTYEPVMPLKRACTITNADGSTWVTDYKFNDSSRFYQTNELGQIIGSRVGLSQTRPAELVVDWDNSAGTIQLEIECTVWRRWLCEQKQGPEASTGG
jgi:hypothetical protein